MFYHWWLEQSINNGWAHADNVFSNDEIDQIIKIGLDPTTATPDIGKIGSDGMGEGALNNDTRVSELSWIRADIKSNRWIFQRLTDVVSELNKRFFQFDLDLIQNLQFTTYPVDGFYKKHIDMGYEAERMRKLSFTIQLTDSADYDCGDVKIYYGEEGYSISKQKGTITAFPSYALHEVEPITRGVRYALVGWVCGPKFK